MLLARLGVPGAEAAAEELPCSLTTISVSDGDWGFHCGLKSHNPDPGCWVPTPCCCCSSRLPWMQV